MRVVVPTVVALVALLLAALVGHDEVVAPRPVAGAASETGSADAGAAGLPDATSSMPSDELAGRERDGLTLAMVEPVSFRPDELSLADQPAVVIADLLYDGLTEIDGHTGELQPALARTWTADASFRRWTFELDPAAGPTADDVAAALAPLVIGRGSQSATSHSGPALAAAMASVTAADDHLLVIELVRPNAGLAWVLSGLPYSVVGVGGAPTGDFEIVRHDANGLRLEARAGGPSSVGAETFEGPEAAGSIEIRWSDDPAAAYGLLADGEVDGAIVDAASLTDAADRFTPAGSASTAVRFYVLNPNAEALSVRDRRAALLGRVDTADLVTAANRPDLLSLGGLVSPGLVGFRAAGCGSQCGDLDDGSADTAVGELAWPSEVPLQVTYAGAGQTMIADALADQLDRAGIPARSSEVTVRELASAIVEGAPALFAFGWVAPAGSVDAVVPPLLRIDSPANVARFSSPGLEELLDEAAVTEDDDARWALLGQAHELALAEARVLPVAASTGTLVWSPDLSGVVQRPDGSIDLES